MADVAKTVSIIFQGEDKTSAALRSVESGLDGIGTEAAGATTKLGAVGDEVEEIGKKGASIDGLADAFQALAGAVVVKAFIDANVEAEKFEKAMTLLKGSKTG